MLLLPVQADSHPALLCNCFVINALQDSLSAERRSSGILISVHTPPIVTVGGCGLEPVIAQFGRGREGAADVGHSTLSTPDLQSAV